MTASEAHKAISELLAGSGTWYDVHPTGKYTERGAPTVELDGEATADELRRIAAILDEIKP
jgi:hypothetical protein